MSTVELDAPRLTVNGDSLTVKVRYAEFDPADGWGAQMFVRSAQFAATVAGTTDPDTPDGFVFNATGEETAKWAVGDHSWGVVFTKDQQRETRGAGFLEVIPDPLKPGGYDFRSHARKVLDAVEAVLEKRATKDQQSYSIGGRSLSRMDVADLLQLADKYRAMVRAEEQDADRKAGRPTRRKIHSRMS